MSIDIIYNYVKNRYFISLFVLVAIATPLMSQVAVGKWRDHLSYNTLYRVEETGERVYASAADALFYYDLEDYTLNRLNKTTTLSDVGISTFAYDSHTHNIVVAYSNSNIDIIKEDKVFNINDLKRSDVGGSKKINNISFNGQKVYLSCAFGIVVLDMRRNEISETYYLGAEGSMMNINDVAFTDSLIVAATDSGLYYAPKNSQRLSIVTTWQRDNGSLLVGQRVVRIDADDEGQLLALVQSADDTTLYREVSSMMFVPFVTGNIRNYKVSQGKTVVCMDRSIEIYGRGGAHEKSVGDIDWMDMQPNDAALTKEGRLWIAHKWASLVAVHPDDVTTLRNYSPGGPWSGQSYRVTTFDSIIYVSPGGHRTTYAGVYNPANIYIYNGEWWRTPGDPDNYLKDKYDVVNVAVDPRDKSHVMAASWGSGIVEIKDNKVVNLYDETNSDGSIIRFWLDDYSSVLTGGIAFDKNGDAWITNSLVDRSLAVRHNDGSWESFSTVGVVTSDIDNIIWDSIHDLKLFWGRQNRIFVHDGKNNFSYIDPNNGAKMQTSSINCLVQDHDGHLWMGANKGIKVIYNLSKAFDGGGNGEASPVTCNNILFNENGITEYLMAYENVTCIAVDGANRKWVGTSSGGLYLLSANGLKQLEHFTAANSPLFSDKILSLAIMPWSGELFVVTDRGLQSYRATATYAFSTPMEDIHAFPNPVRPDFEGEIAIKGFTRNAIVHITDAAGNTVYSTIANGGQAIWNGRTHEGKKVASGVYYVFASAEDGTMRSATKILIVR